MTTTLRVLLLVVSLITSIWILRKIRRCKIKQEDAAYWICFAVILACFGFFPQLSYTAAKMLGIQSPANFVYLVIIFLLLEKLLSVSVQVSQLENKVEIMAAELALRSKFVEDKLDNEKSIVNIDKL